MKRFEALEISFAMIRSLRDVLGSIRRRSDHLGRQIEKAASSVALNLGEGRRRRGKDRNHHYRVAAGSADEVRCGLHVAEAWGLVGKREIAESLDHLDSLLAILWTITEGHRNTRVATH